MAKKVLSGVPEARYKKYGIHFPEGWEVSFIGTKYTEEEFIQAAKEKEYFLLTGDHPITENIIDNCPNLKLIQMEGVGFNNVDTKAAREKGIPVCNNKGANADAVAEATIGLMIECYRTMALYDRRLKEEPYSNVKKDSLAAGVHELKGKHIGFIGMGAIAKEVVKRLQNWKVRMSYYDVFRPSEETESALGITYLSLEELIRECDVISIHVPVLPETVNLLGETQFKAMKKSAMLINTARGEIVDQEALARALEAGEITHAGLDVLLPEPAPADHPLLTMNEEGKRRLTLTPHNAGMTDEAFITMLTGAIANIERVENGETPVNIVNP